ncbi:MULTISPECIES: acetyltransferase [Legionella]|uniref:Chloramphenicol acetyltransferase n=1 Tax=Legionella drozanskii LLAP-1 TaxID=1212489 RepID=A0A0W0SN21_9GAMM|nr:MULTISPECIES: acetyltransferase [Legionella]KTC84731.1 chloramphenicol acetyltransferase [Legionella drozanskii LLAP-1]PJE18477.1 MAG: hexapeptide transferase [Legionella sp.]
MKKGIIIIGAGGHAKVCIELLRSMGEEVSFCIGNDGSADLCLDIPVLQGDNHLNILHEEGYSRIFIAIGSNYLRERLATMAMNEGYILVNAISPQAIISPSARLGSGVAIMAGVVINAEANIADLAIINTGATVDHDCQIAKAVHIAPQCALAGNVKVGSQSFLGVGSKVIPEIEIGEKVILGAGTVVISNIINGATAVGVPARIINKSVVGKECHATNISRTA